MTPTNTTVLRGSTVSLNCSTDANPAAHVYQFYFNDSFISTSSSGLLNISVDTDGVYTGVPINKVGTGHNTTVRITMVGKSLIFFSISVLGFEANRVVFWSLFGHKKLFYHKAVLRPYNFFILSTLCNRLNWV